MPLDPRLLRAEEVGIRLEIVAGLAIWEAAPPWRHQKAIDRIRGTIRARPCLRRRCAVSGWFTPPARRRDLCREPDEQDDAITLVPEAVIEVVNKGYAQRSCLFGGFEPGEHVDSCR